MTWRRRKLRNRNEERIGVTNDRSGQQESEPAGVLWRLIRRIAYGGFYSVAGLLALELALISSVSNSVLSDFPWLASMVSAMEGIAPIIGKFNSGNSTQPEVVRLGLALGVILMVPKAIAIYLWLNGNRAWRQQLIVSPLTETHAASANDFTMEPMHGAAKMAPAPQRSWKSRLIWSVLIVAFPLFACWIILDGGRPDGASFKDNIAVVGRGAGHLWFAWSFKWMTFTALLFAVSGRVWRDAAVFLWQRFTKTTEGEGK